MQVSLTSSVLSRLTHQKKYPWWLSMWTACWKFVHGSIFSITQWVSSTVLVCVGIKCVQNVMLCTRVVILICYFTCSHFDVRFCKCGCVYTQAWIDIRLFLSRTLATRIDTNQSHTSDIHSHHKTHGCRLISLLMRTDGILMFTSGTNAKNMILVWYTTCTPPVAHSCSY